MNSSTKSIFQLFESVCVLEGYIQNASFHSKRFIDSYQKFYWQSPDFELLDSIRVPSKYQKGKVKLRISYNKTERKHFFLPYIDKKVKTLKIIFDDTIDYDLKFEDRSHLDALFEQRKDCDDILIVRNEWLTDSSYANIIFWEGTKWYTPSSCLLKGSKRSQLLETGTIEEIPIGVEDLKNFQGFQLINAMLDFRPDTFLPIENIKF